MVNMDMLDLNWKQLRNQVRQHWQALTEDALEMIDGHFDVLVDLLREKYGYSKSYAEDEVEQFIRKTTGYAV